MKLVEHGELKDDSNDQYEKEIEDDFSARYENLKKYVVKHSSVIATRELFFTLKGEVKKNKLAVKLYAPIEIEASARKATAPHGKFVCYVEFSHLCCGHVFYGYDEFQVISFASDLDPYLRALDKKCNLYFTDHVEDVFYFDDACNRW